MAVEFRCTQCNKLLRIGDDAAGGQAKCPECGAIVPVPSRPAPGAPGAEEDSPFAPAGQPAGAADATNPFKAPGQYAQPSRQSYRPPVVHEVPNYLLQAILCTVFCCQPFGIVAIVFAAQVNGKLAAGDYHGAVSYSNSARTWCWVSFWLVFVWVIFWFVIMLMMPIAAGVG